METDFRHSLRERSRSDHDRLDRMITSLDIARVSDFALFLRLHLSYFLVMQSRSSDQNISAATLSDMVDGLTADLGIVSRDHPAVDTPLPAALDPLAVDYMVAGSRLGSKILRKRWGASADPIVQNANNYFRKTGDPNLWPDVCRALSAVPMESERARAIVKDTKTLFQLFAAVFTKLAKTEDTLI